MINEDVWGEIHTSVFGRHPALPKECDSIEEFSQIFGPLEYKMAKLYVIRRLSAQNLPSTVLSKALKDRLISDQTIERVIEGFQRDGYLNDVEWTNGFVQQQLSRKLGPRAIASKLMNKGLPKEQIEDSLQLMGSESQQKDSIVQLLATKYKKRNLADFKEKQKVIASLARRGFNFSLIMEVLRH